MEGHSFRQSLFFSSAIAVSVLLAFNLLFMAFCLHQSSTAERQLILAQRILSYAVRDQECEDVKAAVLLPEVLETGVACEWEVLPLLHLLHEGGGLAGKNIPRFENHEIVFLLNSMISLRQSSDNNQPGTSSHIALDQLFYSKAKTLADTLVFRAIRARDRLWIAFRFMVVLVLAVLLSGFFVARIFLAKERVSQRDKDLFGLGNQLLMDLPEALLLLDKSLSLKFVNRLAESYFGQLSGFSPERNFGFFCQDQSLLKRLRDSLQEVTASSHENVFVQPEEVLLQHGHGRKFLVVIKWHKLYLVEQNYYLGVIYNPEEDRREELNVEIVQGQLADLSNNLFEIQDEERRHLADELHDGLCQSLAALKMQVFGIERHLENDKLREECRMARQFIAQIIEDTRRLSHDLSPVILDDLGLSAALSHLVSNFTALHNLKASVAVSSLDDIFSQEESRNIYRIVQEAINNVGKHAKASLLVLEAEITGDAVCFSIKDDGVGFAVDATERGRDGRSGLGLPSMAHRVRLLGGELEVVSQLGDGSEIKFTLPKK